MEIVDYKNNCWVEVSQLPEELKQYGFVQFAKLFELHPPEKASVLVHTRQEKADWVEEKEKRWMKSYLKTPPMDKSHPDQRSYMFAGDTTSDVNGPLPVEFQPFLEYMQKEDPRYNQVVINWYDSEDLIPFHHDCELGMVKDHKITSISLYGPGAEWRYLHLQKRKDANGETSELVLPHGQVTAMCGDFQKHFRHAVHPGKGRRISITFRQFEE